jgi:oxygen-independent coproporphyrinogen-3 oxidase
MTAAVPALPADLLRRYDRPGPRYTSYPTVPQFRTDLGEADLRSAIARSNGDPIPRRLSLYVHVPFCASPCFYCGCNRVITRDRQQGEAYLERLLREIDRVAPLFDPDREVIQLHFGGGTPNFLSPGQIGRIVGRLRERFRLSTSAARDFSIEMDPRTVVPTDIGELAALGFNRASLGVQDFNPEVQQAVNRVQSVEDTLAVLKACRDHHFRSVNVDLIYGLPKQTTAGFAQTLDTVIAARPDRLAIYSYAHLPTLFKGQRRIHADDLPSPEAKLGLLQLATRMLGAAGYEAIGMDHFALPLDDLARAQRECHLHRNFMGYTTCGDCDQLGFGVSAISRIDDLYVQNHRDLPNWNAAIDRGDVPIARGLRLSTDDLLREDVIHQIMCDARVDIADVEARHGIAFATYFTEAIERLQPLVADGLVAMDARAIRLTEAGRALRRHVAMCFDRYLGQSTAAPAQYSKAI